MIALINDLVKWVDTVFLLAPAPFTIFVVIGFGYILRGVKWVNNDWIPNINLVVGTAVYVMLNLRKARPDMTHTEFLIRVVFTGLVISFAAWKFHETILSRVEDKVPWLRDWIGRGNAADSAAKPTDNKPTEIKP